MKTFIIKSNNLLFKKNNVQSLFNNVKKTIGILFFWLLVWQIIYFIINKEILIAAPINTFFKLLDLFKTTEFWITTFSSVIRIMQGYLVAILLGLGFAYITTKYKLFNMVLSPALNVIKTTPVASFVVLALVFIKTFYIPSFISFLMVVPIIWANTKEGIQKTDTKLLEMAKVFKINKFSILKQIYIPSIMPHFMSACSVGLGFAWKAGIAAEVIGNTQLSIGREIYNSKIYMDTVSLFAWTIIVIAISFFLEKIIIKLTTYVIKKYNLER